MIIYPGDMIYYVYPRPQIRCHIFVVLYVNKFGYDRINTINQKFEQNCSKTILEEMIDYGDIKIYRKNDIVISKNRTL